MKRFGGYRWCVLAIAAAACSRSAATAASAPAPAPDSIVVARVVASPPPISMTARVPVSGLDTAKWVDSTIASLSLRERIGQMVWFWTLGDYTAADDSTFSEALGWVEKDGVGGLSMSL